MTTVVKLSTAVREFLNEDPWVRELSAGRQRLYKRTMDSLLRVTGTQLQACELKSEHIDDCVGDLIAGAGPEEAAIRRRCGWAERKGRRGETLNSDYAALRAFTDFLHRRDYLTAKRDPTGHLRSALKTDEHHISEMVLPTTAFGDLLNAAGKRHPRDRAIVALGLFAGFRDSEIRALRVSGVDFDAGTISVYRQKKRKWHTVPISKGLERELRVWFGWLEGMCGPLQRDWFVIGPRPKGWVGTKVDAKTPVDPTRQISRSRDVVKTVLADLGVTDLYRPGTHTLRRMAANAAMDHTGGDLRAAKTLLGHEDERQTEHYLRKDRDLDRLKDAIGDFDPLAGESEELAPVVDLASRRQVA